MFTQNNSPENKKNKSLTIREMALFAMLGTIMFCSKIVMEGLPNIHLLGMLTITYTIVFRAKALIPIYIYVMVNGLFAGFAMWWVPYLYIWAILWAVTIILPKRMPKKAKYVVYAFICYLHGVLFGTLYAPVHAIMYGFNFDQTIAWIMAGLPFDIIHGIGNLFASLLIVPMSELLIKLTKQTHIK